MSGVEPQRTASQIRETIAGWRAAHETVALVPTMGNLHAGHLSLVHLAAEHADRVILTIFVNPTQFGVGEDFESYPRTLEQDRSLIASAGVVDALFVPEQNEIYPAGLESAFSLSVPALADELCGASRPGHFDGVATVVLRLLNIVSPDLLVLGRKDYQQLVILTRMIADLRLPVGMIAGETFRDPDGLAISSRNAYLSATERRTAPRLYEVLNEVGQHIVSGNSDFAELENNAVKELGNAGFRPDYVEVRRADDLGKPDGNHSSQELIVLGAAWLGNARLIDNISIS